VATEIERKFLVRDMPELGGADGEPMVQGYLRADTGGSVRLRITGNGLVGRVSGLGSRSARILLITDLNSRIPVAIEPSRARAVLAGDNSDRPRLIHLPPGADLSPGDMVVTSGHGGAFPVGMPVGVVAAVSDNGITVQPFVDRARLEVVRVVEYGLAGILGEENIEERPITAEPPKTDAEPADARPALPQPSAAGAEP